MKHNIRHQFEAMREDVRQSYNTYDKAYDNKDHYKVLWEDKLKSLRKFAIKHNIDHLLP